MLAMKLRCVPPHISNPVKESRLCADRVLNDGSEQMSQRKLCRNMRDVRYTCHAGAGVRLTASVL